MENCLFKKKYITSEIYYYFSFNCSVFGDRLVDDEDIRVVNYEDCVSNYVCLLQNKARFPTPTPNLSKGKDGVGKKREYYRVFFILWGMCAFVPSVLVVVVLLINIRKTELLTLERKAVEWRITKWPWPWQCIDVSETLTL